MDAFISFSGLKKKYNDYLVLVRNEDSYFTFLDDAVALSLVLGTVLTKENDVSVTSFFAHALDVNLPKLVRAGHRVAICDVIGNLDV